VYFGEVHTLLLLPALTGFTHILSIYLVISVHPYFTRAI
jgi:hypothetical protein